ncbi:hypothetical protein QBC43DRAFT_72373 [Cladorrhinum sp. PSN259]|nr:hypothetical protein QBC43DRAFT_72373 [Cladorrhinum sp. PSN259]
MAADTNNLSESSGPSTSKSNSNSTTVPATGITTAITTLSSSLSSSLDTFAAPLKRGSEKLRRLGSRRRMGGHGKEEGGDVPISGSREIQVENATEGMHGIAITQEEEQEEEDRNGLKRAALAREAAEIILKSFYSCQGNANTAIAPEKGLEGRKEARKGRSQEREPTPHPLSRSSCATMPDSNRASWGSARTSESKILDDIQEEAGQQVEGNNDDSCDGVVSGQVKPHPTNERSRGGDCGNFDCGKGVLEWLSGKDPETQIVSPQQPEKQNDHNSVTPPAPKATRRLSIGRLFSFSRRSRTSVAAGNTAAHRDRPGSPGGRCASKPCLPKSEPATTLSVLAKDNTMYCTYTDHNKPRGRAEEVGNYVSMSSNGECMYNDQATASKEQDQRQGLIEEDEKLPEEHKGSMQKKHEVQADAARNQLDAANKPGEDDLSSQMMDMSSCFKINSHPAMRSFYEGKNKELVSMPDVWEQSIAEAAKPKPKPKSKTIEITFPLADIEGKNKEKTDHRRRRGIDKFNPPEFRQRSSSYGHGHFRGGSSPTSALFGSSPGPVSVHDKDNGVKPNNLHGKEENVRSSPSVASCSSIFRREDISDGFPHVNTHDHDHDAQAQDPGMMKEGNSEDWNIVGSDGCGGTARGNGGNSGESGGTQGSTDLLLPSSGFFQSSSSDSSPPTTSPRQLPPSLPAQPELTSVTSKKASFTAGAGGSLAGAWSLFGPAINWPMQRTVRRMTQRIWKISLGGDKKRGGSGVMNNWHPRADPGRLRFSQTEAAKARRVEGLLQFRIMEDWGYLEARDNYWRNHHLRPPCYFGDEVDEQNVEERLSLEQRIILQTWYVWQGQPGPSRPRAVVGLDFVVTREEVHEEKVGEGEDVVRG